MIFALLVTVSIGLCSLALIGLSDSHQRFTQFLEELDEQAARQSEHHGAVSRINVLPPIPMSPLVADPSGERLFTHSLLALGKVGSPVLCGSPAPERAVSSSSVSVPQDQLKNRGQAL